MKGLLTTIIYGILTCFPQVFSTCPVRCNCKGTVLECSQTIPNYLPDNITKLVARYVSFGNSFDFSDPSWHYVYYLEIIASEDSEKDDLRQLQHGEFANLRKLRHLKLTCNCLNDINQFAFAGLDQLKVLDLSNNGRLGIPSVVNGIKGSGILPVLTELYLSNISSFRTDPIVLDKSFCEAIEHKSLNVLDISNNEHNHIFFSFEASSFVFQSIQKLNMSNDRHLAAQLSLKSFTGLKILDVSYASNRFTAGRCLFASSYIGYPDLRLPSNLTELYAKKVSVLSLNINGFSNSTHLCMPECGTDIPYCFYGPSDSLTKFVFSDNSLQYLEPSMLHVFRNLRYLDFSKNILGDAMARGNYSTSCFDILINLKVLILSENGITSLQYDTFRGSKLLRILNLSKNRLKTVMFETAYLISLEVIDISSNEISFLDAAAIQRLNSLTEVADYNHQTSEAITEYVPLSDDAPITFDSAETGQGGRYNITQVVTQIHSTNIIMTDNPFECSCHTVQFLKWLLALNQSYLCHFKSVIRPIDDSAVESAQFLCIEMTVIVVSSIAAFLATTLLSLAIVKTIHKRRRMRQKRQVRNGIEMYGKIEAIPVFLSFCSEDEDTVMDEIFLFLDEGLREILHTDKRCVSVGGMDFRPGIPLVDEIIRCIDAASVVVFFVTNNFCKKMWCRSEAFIAHNENKPSILMLWENVDVKRMPKHMYRHFQLHTRVHWREKDGARVMFPDWKVLCETIVRLFGKEQI